MKFFRLWLGAVIAMFAAGAVQAQSLSITAITAAPSTAKPGDSVTYTIAVSNSGAGAVSASETATFTIQHVNTTTGYSFTVSGTGQPLADIPAPTVSGTTTTPGTGTFTVTSTVPTQTTESGSYRATVTGADGPSAATLTFSSSFSASTTVLTVTGTPDFQITSLTHTSSTNYRGGEVLPMTLTYRNNSASSGTTNVPWVPTTGTTYFRIHVVLSSNPTYGDADDFQLTFFDRSTKLDANNTDVTFSWSQLLPGNFSGSYYVLAKIDSMNQVAETVENDLTQNGNNIWQDVAATRIALQPTTFPTIYLASTTGTTGTSPSGNGYSDNPSLTADGRYTAYASDASNLVTGDTNAVRDIFLFDSQNSLVRRVNLSQQGAQANANSNNPALSGNGRYVAFSSDATNLIIGDVNGFTDIFVVDTLTGAISLQSVTAAGVQANGSSFRPAMSHTGRYLVFESSATNLVTPGTTAGVTHIYLRNRDVSNSGTFDTPGNTSTVLIDTSTAAGNAHASQASISADGQFVTFASRATNLATAATTAGRQHIYVRDVTGATTTIVSVGTGGAEANADSRNPSINRNTGVTTGIGSDGRFVAFASDATNLVAGDANAVSDVFVFDRTTSTTARVSVSSAGVEAVDPTVNTTFGSKLGSLNPSISATGRYVTFASLANNLAPGDNVGRYNAAGSGNAALNIYVVDRDVSASGTYGTAGNISTTNVSVNRFGYQAYYILNTQSTAAADIFPVISADGRWVAFPFDAEGASGLIHNATNMLSSDANGARDVALFDRRTNSLPTAATPPTVNITNPGNSSSALVNTQINVTASATTTTGVVSTVQFFVNGTSIGSSNAFPYTAPWTPTAVGNYTLSALVTDSFGNLGVSPSIAVTINAAPSVGITSPTSTATITAGSAQTVTASASASNPGATITSVQFFVNGITLGTSTVAPYTAPWTPTAAGSYTLTATATDSVGTQTTSPAVTLTVAAGGGGGGGGGGGTVTVSVLTPATGAVLSVNTPQSVVASATATGGTVTSVEFFANGGSIGAATTFPYRVSWTPTTPGSYAITATATDQSGAQATSAANAITVTAGAAPSITLVSPASNSTISVGTAQTLVANATAGSGIITGVEFFANGLLLGADTTFPYNLSWIPTGVGPASLTAVATDTLGNQTSSPAVAITVASVSPTAPTVAITSPAAGAAVPIGIASIIAATAADPDGTIASVQFFANGIPVGAIDTTFPFNTPFTPTSSGNYVLTAQAIDNGGNITTSASITVNVAGNAAPNVAVTSPAAGTAVAVNAPQTLTANASSSGGVITSVQFFVNGLAVGTLDTTFPYSTEWTPLAVGTYSVAARATDNVGNITDSAPIVVTAAGSAPATVSITNPVNGSSFTVGTLLSLTANSADADGTIASVQFFVNGVAVGAADTSAPYASPWTPTSVGVYTITAKAIDNTGNVTTSAPVTVTIGANAAPVIALTSPAGGLSYSLGSQVLVAAAASDADGTVANVQFFANGLLIGTSTTVPFLVSWRPTAAGNYTLTAIATDNAGNATTTAAVAVTVTSVGAPSVAITNPAPGSSFVAGNAIPLVAHTTGGNGPIAQVQFFINGAPLGTPDTTSPYTASWTPGAPGTYSVIAVGTDSAGISSNSPALDVVITGNVAPTSVISSPSSGTTVTSGTALNITATATDVDGTVTSVRFLANGNVVATATAAPFIGTWTPTAIGSYNIVAQAQDNSGNITNSAPIVLNVSSNQTPTVVLTSPANGSAVRVNTNVTVNATASDPDGTITSVQFFANGVALGAADTTAPYSASFTPPAEGVYRITAVALDNSGASTTSSGVSLAVVAAGASDTVYTGTYAGLSESGRFAAVVVRGKTAAFIGYSTSGGNRTYFFPSLTVDSAGGFATFDSVGRSLVSGTANETGVTGTIDNGRLTFIGVVSFASSSLTSLAGYYSGSLTGRNTSSLSAIVAGDGSIMVLVEDGTFRDAGSGNISTTGGFSVTTPAGNRITGTIDLATGFMAGTLVGGPGGPFTAAIASGVSFSDGFLRNLSTRGQVGTGGNILIAGFVVSGNSPKQVLIRAIGPSLAGFGITNALADPQLELFNGNTLIASNDNWGGAAAISAPSNQAGAFPLSPSSLDAVIYTSLPPGSYTAQVSGVGGRTGVALVELYDTDALQPFAAQKVTNVATRGVVGTGPNQLIAGFVVSGNTSKKVLIRGVGPTLANAPFNVAGVLADPILKLVRSSGGDTVVRENDNWEMGNDASLINEAAVKVGAFPLASGARDAAMLINLPPGTYSAQVTGPGTTTGVALVEVYEVP